MPYPTERLRYLKENLDASDQYLINDIQIDAVPEGARLFITMSASRIGTITMSIEGDKNQEYELDVDREDKFHVIKIPDGQLKSISLRANQPLGISIASVKIVSPSI